MNLIRRWLLRRLGVLSWLDELACLAGRTIAAEDRRDKWRARAEDAERLTQAYAEVFDQIIDPAATAAALHRKLFGDPQSEDHSPHRT